MLIKQITEHWYIVKVQGAAFFGSVREEVEARADAWLRRVA